MRLASQWGCRTKVCRAWAASQHIQTALQMHAACGAGQQGSMLQCPKLLCLCFAELASSERAPAELAVTALADGAQCAD